MNENLETATIEDESSSGATDDVRGALEAAFAEHKVEIPESGLRPRDETGKFAKRKAEAEDAVVVGTKPVTAAAPAAATAAATGAEVVDPNAQTVATGAEVKVAAPNTWKAEAKAEWDKVPPSVQKYITEREAEIHKGFTRFDEERTFGKSIKDVMAPFMPTISQLGLQPATAVQALMNHDRTLRHGTPAEKTQLISQLVHQFGVDIGQVREQSGAINPDVAALRTELSRLQHTVTQSQTQAQEAENAVIAEEIQRFGADKPHFETVRPLMSSLMLSGSAQDLQSAYEQAVYANPTTRAAVLADEAAKREADRVAAIKVKSDAAKKAAVSITGAPGSQASTSGQPAGSLREELAAQFAAQGLT